MKIDKENPLVSIIIPVYNVERYLDRCIQSLLQQEYENIEILLIDDGSKDQSGKICDSYIDDKRVNVFHQINKGLSEARNKGLDIAKGEYIAFVDGDDYVSPFFISHALEKLKTSNADIVLFNFAEIRQDNIVISESPSLIKWHRQLQKGNNEICDLLLADCIPNFMWNKLYKRSVWEQIRFPVGYTYEDLFTTAKILRETSSIIYLPEVLYYYERGNVNSISSALASLKPWNRYCHFLGLWEHEKICKKNKKIFRSIILTKTLQEGIETLITQYGNPSLNKDEVNKVINFIKINRKNPLAKMGTKTVLIGELLIKFPTLGKIYSQHRYLRKIKKLHRKEG